MYHESVLARHEAHRRGISAWNDRTQKARAGWKGPGGPRKTRCAVHLPAQNAFGMGPWAMLVCWETLVADKPEGRWNWWYLLLLFQFVPTLWVPFYNSVE